MSEVQGNHAKSGASTTWQIIGRLVAAAVVLAITAFFTPGFTINNFWAFNHNPEDYAKSIKQPILMMYGKKDLNVTNQETQQIFKNLISENKVLKTFPEAGHENYLNRFGEEWKENISLFLNDLK